MVSNPPLRTSTAIALSWATLMVAACQSLAAPRANPAESGAPVESATESEDGARLVALPDGWMELGRYAFEEWLAQAFAGDRPAALTDSDVDSLAAALTGWNEGAARAALILSHADASTAARDALIERLELRALAPDRPSDAGDVIAAAGLATRADGSEVAARLAVLAVGPSPHPDLEVRVECAATALSFGHDEVVPFLLRVLRELTPLVRDDPPDWEPKTTMAWSKSRAAHALSLAADLPLTFRPDASVEDQLREAQRLEDALSDG